MNASNTPFRLHQRWTHEGVISTPAMVSCPDGIVSLKLIDEPTHNADIPATIYDIVDAEYSGEIDCREITPLERRSFKMAIVNDGRVRTVPIFLGARRK